MDHDIKPSTYQNLLYLIKNHKDGATVTFHKSSKVGDYYELRGEGFYGSGDTICQCINAAYGGLTEPEEIEVNGVKYIKK